MINAFKGKYFYLSNYYEIPVEYEGIMYQNSEAAFQAAKVKNIKIRQKFSTLNPSSAKRKGQKVQLRHDWEKVKIQVMYDVVKAKFTQNPELREKLLSTEDEYLEEGNTWGDRVWGTVNGKGKNNLGKVLMQVRDELREENK